MRLSTRQFISKPSTTSSSSRARSRPCKAPLGSGTQGSFGDALVQYGFVARDGGPINKAIRSHLKTLLDNEQSVRAWWETVRTKRGVREWLSASAIHKHWRASQRPPDAARKPSPAAGQPRPSVGTRPGEPATKPSADKAAGPREADPAVAENARLKARIAVLELRLKWSGFSEVGYIMPEKQFTNLRGCMHPDNVAFLEAVAKDNPALRDKVESLIKQFAKAATVLSEFKDVLVNRPAEEQKKRSDAFRAAARWKINEEIRKKDEAKREKAAAKRAAAKAAKGLK